MGHLFDNEVQIEPTIWLSVVLVDASDILTLTDGNPLVEEDHAFFSRQSLDRVRYFAIDLELHNFTQLTDSDVIRDMEAEKETANYSLALNHLLIDAFDDYSKQLWVLEFEILVFDLALSYTIKS